MELKKRFICTLATGFGFTDNYTLTLKEKLVYALATGFGLTDTKWAPGTIGSLIALPFCAWLVSMQNIWLHLGSIVAVFATGIWCVPLAEEMLPPRIKNRYRGLEFHDQGEITIDEVLGMLVATVPLHFAHFGISWFDYTLAFALFRYFDIQKFGPAAWLDRISAGWAVMLDDFVAGIFAGAAYQALALVRMLFTR